jgi:hypothetical protein
MAGLCHRSSFPLVSDILFPVIRWITAPGPMELPELAVGEAAPQSAASKETYEEEGIPEFSPALEKALEEVCARSLIFCLRGSKSVFCFI